MGGVESTTGAVAVGLGELPSAGRFTEVPVPHSGPWLRFQSPLVKPDMQIARIRLSPASSSLRTRQVDPAPWQGVEAERLVEILVRIWAIPGACLATASHQPALQTPLYIPTHQLVDRQNRSLVEVLGPAT